MNYSKKDNVIYTKFKKKKRVKSDTVIISWILVLSMFTAIIVSPSIIYYLSKKEKSDIIK
jgi:Na+-transporting NADH:ubiquinone oxidoreductase subunit NqrC